MKNIIIFIFIVLSSCTYSGKLTDSKFPYYPTHYKLRSEQINATAPINVGSYVIQPTFIDWAAIDKEQRRYNVITISILFGIVAIPILWAFGSKEKELPEGTFKVINKTSDITKILKDL